MTDKKRALPELSIDTQTIERILSALPVNEIATYAVMSAAIGRDVQNDARHLLNSAITRRLRDGEVYGVVINVGMKRLDDAGIVGTGALTAKRIRNLSRKGLKKLMNLKDYTSLPRQLQNEFNTRAAQLGILKAYTGTAKTRRIAGAVDALQKQFDPKESLKLISNI